MPANASDASSSASAERERRIATPQGELARMRADEAREAARLPTRIMEAMLVLCGEMGYRNVSVQHVIDRYGGYRLQFYRQFRSKAECYAAAYAVEAERLCAALLEAGAGADGWRAGLRTALDELAGFACERPALARGVLVEVHVAGGPALAKRKEVLERLSRAIDSARRETGSRHSPPPITASFIVSAIESSVTTALSDGEPRKFLEAVPELADLFGAYYFSD